MSKLGKITVLATAAEAARQWAKNNPNKAHGYIEKAGAVVNQRTKGKYSKQITGATAKAKEAVAKQTGGTSGGGTTAAPPAPAGQTGTSNPSGTTPSGSF